MQVRIRRGQLDDINSVYKLASLFTTGAEPVSRDEFTLVYETVLIERDFESAVVLVAEALDVVEENGSANARNDAGDELESVTDLLPGNDDGDVESSEWSEPIRPGQIIGYSLMSVSRLLHTSGLSGHLHEIVVAPQARGRGVGEALIEANERYAMRRGVRQISAYTARFGSFYNHLGFEVVGEHFRKFLNTW